MAVWRKAIGIWLFTEMFAHLDKVYPLRVVEFSELCSEENRPTQKVS